jgi:hypothetical protein
MFSRLIPRSFDNTYQGRGLALWLFGLVVLLRVVMSLNSIINSRTIAISADGIPLDTYPPAAAQTVVSLFSLLGLAGLVICLLCILALVRFRSMIPLMFLVLLLHFLGARLILLILPIARNGTPPGTYVNLTLFVLLAVGLVLSLQSGGLLRSANPNPS